MAPSTRRRAVTAPHSTEEWSCALCTLLNHWEDERCAACDQERPPPTQAAAQTPVDPTPTQQTSQYGQLVGVFFKAATPSTAWRNEPRLRVNRRKRPLQQQTSGRSDPPRMTTPFASAHEPTRRLPSVANDRAATRAGDYPMAEAPRFDLLRSDPPRISPTTASDDPFEREDTTHARPSAANSQDTQHTSDSFMTEAPSFSLLQPDPPRISTTIPSNEGVERQIKNENTRRLPSVANESNTSDDSDPPMVEAPSFSLLGSMDFAITTATEHENTCETQEHEADDVVPSMPSFSLLGNMASEIAPASPPRPVSARAENADSQAKMAQAGLDLSDSENDDVAPRPLQRRKNRVSTTPPTEPDQQATWECPTCTHLNAKSSSRCELCEQGPGVWECSICTHRNARSSTRCELCESRDQPATWECSTCTHLNAKSSARCEVCGPGEEDQATWECPICTNYNDGSLTRCELCDTPRERVATRAATSRVYQPETIDLATSQYDDEVQKSGRKHQESFYDDYNDEEEEYDPNDDEDFETIYGYNDPDIGSEPENYPQSRNRGARDYDRVEDISDNEAPTPFEPPRRVRPELEAFQHFTSVEDVAGDFGCKIDYRGMFADSSRGKSYGERLQKRKRESQKRNREAAQREQQFGSLPGFESARTLKESRAKKSKKAASGKASRSKKAKATLTARRASTSRVAAAKRATKAKAGVSSTARRSSAPACQSTVNHYDLSGADFGEDVSTMAWEGVGSAGYY